MKRKSICDICGEDAILDIEQELFKAGTWGNTAKIDTCFDCTKKLSKYAQKLRGGNLGGFNGNKSRRE